MSKREQELIALLRNVLYNKLQMWDHANLFEDLAGIEIDTASDSFDSYCSGFDDCYTAWTVDDSVIRSMLTDEQWEQALSADSPNA